MKGKKKFAALILSFLMAFLLLPVSALAANPAEPVKGSTNQPLVTDPTTTGTLTINKGTTTATYAVYKLYGYTVNSPAEKIYTYTANPDITWTGLKTPDEIAALTTAQALSDFTKQLRQQISKNPDTLLVHGNPTDDNIGPTRTADATADNGYTATFNNLPIGYYLVIETATGGGKTASKDFFVSVPQAENNAWNYEVEVDSKDTPVHFDKTITDGTEDKNGVTRGLDETVDYRLNADLPRYDDSVTAVTFEMHDKLSKGLAYQGDVQIYGVNADGSQGNDLTSHFDISPTQATNGAAETILTIELKQGTAGDPLADYKAISADYEKVVAVYSAKVTSDAIIGSDGNPNEAFLRYTNGPGTTHDSEHKTTYVYTFGLNIVKLGDESAKLKDAEFDLYDTDPATPGATAIATATTDQDGKLFFERLDAGTYYIKETVAPDGYTLYPNTIIVTIVANPEPDGSLPSFGSANYKITVDLGAGAGPTLITEEETVGANLYAKFDVLDTAGFTLPGTGGIGTKIFFASGSGILLAGGCMAVVYTKKKKRPSQHSKQQ